MSGLSDSLVVPYKQWRGKRDITRSLIKTKKKGDPRGLIPGGVSPFAFFLSPLSIGVCVPVPVSSLPSSFLSTNEWHRSPLIRNIGESVSAKVWSELSFFFFWLTLSHFVHYCLFSFLILPTIITSPAPSHPHFPLLLLEHSHPRTLTSFGQPHTHTPSLTFYFSHCQHTTFMAPRKARSTRPLSRALLVLPLILLFLDSISHSVHPPTADAAGASVFETKNPFVLDTPSYPQPTPRKGRTVNVPYFVGHLISQQAQQSQRIPEASSNHDHSSHKQGHCRVCYLFPLSQHSNTGQSIVSQMILSLSFDLQFNILWEHFYLLF